MLITNIKIEVTYEMMETAGMTKFQQVGVPVDPKNPSKGLRWKNWAELTDEDFDAIEEYFLLKK